MQIRSLASLACVASLALSACNDQAGPEPSPDPQDRFWAALSSHCGNAYAGTLASDDDADADFQNADMVMHVRECSDDRIAIPFHVKLGGEWDRSRTWVLTRSTVAMPGTEGVTGSIQLKHDHRHADGASDAVTMYGGSTHLGDALAAEGTARRQDFPVDADSVALFEREGLTASVTNVWSIEVDPADKTEGVFAYQLRRTVEGGAPEERFFRVEFDLSQPVEPPPPAWGWD
ncbi:hypothetical protein ACI5KX_00300 [Erythrobacter sp. GH1-10]|uniref:hypothetical protein n=1 Tax=Erythrobacter sp. GH1-10 TaxID=3349334 RepID=UPI003877C885